MPPPTQECSFSDADEGDGNSEDYEESSDEGNEEGNVEDDSGRKRSSRWLEGVTLIAFPPELRLCSLCACSS